MVSTVAISEITLVAGSVYGALVPGRKRVALYFIKKAMVEITARGERLSQDMSGFFVEPAEEKGGPVQTLLQFGREASSYRLAAKQEALGLKQKLPSTRKTVTAADVREILSKVSVLFTTVYSETIKRKLQESVKSAVKHALVERSRHSAAGQVIETAHSAIHDGGHDMAHDLAQRGLHHLPSKWIINGDRALDVVQRPVADIMDQIGATDILVDGTAIVLGAAPDIAISAVDAATDMLVVPGLISGVKSLWREVGMLGSGETDFGDSFINGFVPAGIKTGAVAAGAAIDASFGFMTLGLFTALGYFAGSRIKTAIHKDEIEAGLRQLKPHLQAINLRKAEAVRDIGDSITTNFVPFLDHIETLPDFFRRRDIIVLIHSLAASFGADSRRAVMDIQRLHRGVISETPGNGFLDWMLWIDRKGVALSHYGEIVRNRVSEIEKVNADISKWISNDNTEPVFFAVLTRPQYRDGEVLGRVAETIVAAPFALAGYYSDLDAWKHRGTPLAQAATEAVSRTSTASNEAVRELERRLSADMADARSRIRANMKRLGLDPKSCP